MKFEDAIEGVQQVPSEFTSSLKRKNTFLGTAEYLSPEVLSDKFVGTETDLWALGCIIYQMFTGNSPFKEKTEYLVFRKIMEQKINYPTDIPLTALNLIQSLLVQDPKLRLGAGAEGR
jgi:3-phosphoinositide dependent protein kinase-1